MAAANYGYAQITKTGIASAKLDAASNNLTIWSVDSAAGSAVSESITLQPGSYGLRFNLVASLSGYPPAGLTTGIGASLTLRFNFIGAGVSFGGAISRFEATAPHNPTSSNPQPIKVLKTGDYRNFSADAAIHGFNPGQYENWVEGSYRTSLNGQTLIVDGRGTSVASGRAYVSPSFLAGTPTIRITVTEPIVLMISGNLGAGNVGDSQAFPFLPLPDGEFRSGRSGAWFDPPMASGYDFQMLGVARFSEIMAFPVGIDQDDRYEVWVGEQSLGTFSVGQSVNFRRLFGADVPAFRITGIDPAVQALNPMAFPIQLAFNTPTADFTMLPIVLPFIDISRTTWGGIEIGFAGMLESSTDLINWSVIGGATSPYRPVVSEDEPRMFFKVSPPHSPIRVPRPTPP